MLILPTDLTGRVIGAAIRADFLVDDRLVVEIKCVEQVPPIAEAQMITYMRLLGVRQGLLINFNVRRLVDGVRRFVDTRGAWRPAIDPQLVESPPSDPTSTPIDNHSVAGAMPRSASVTPW